MYILTEFFIFLDIFRRNPYNLDMEITAVIRLGHTISELQTNSKELIETLENNFKFRPKGYFHNAAYKRRQWDGFTRFFTKGKFLTGLLPEVSFVIRKSFIECQVIDERKSRDFSISSIDENFLCQFQNPNDKKFILEDYQADLANQAIKHKRGIITAPTSAGKSAIMVCIVKALGEGVPTLVLQNRRALAIQNRDELIKWGVNNVGSFWGGSLKPNIITCATVQSALKMDSLLENIECVIVDEIHDMMSDTAKQIYKKLKKCGIRIAVSATPFKDDDKVQKYFTKGYFGAILKTKTTKTGVLTVKELQERGRLSSSRSFFFEIKTPLIPYAIYQEAVQLGIVENYELHDLVVKFANALKGRTLILVDRIAHGDILSNMIPDAIWVKGKDDEKTRKDVIEKLQNAKGNLVAIGTQQIFNTGINIFIHNCINACGGQATHTITQRIGRGLRTTADKNGLIYLDFLFRINDYLEKHSEKRIQILREGEHAVSITTPEDFLEILQALDVKQK
jgi:superfamily II DNA or RNA helicase